MIAQGGEAGMKAAYDIVLALSAGKIPPVMLDPKLSRSLWERQTAVMEKYNEPGRFTAFIGYEWTSNNTGNNLHRNVIYRDGKAKADQAVPFTTIDSENPEDLWKWMQAYEEKTGGSLLAIPHNGNLSNGLMFARRDVQGQPAHEGVGRGAGPVGADLRDHPDQGRRRIAPVAVAERRVRRLRDVGQGQPDARCPRSPECSSTSTRGRP